MQDTQNEQNDIGRILIRIPFFANLSEDGSRILRQYMQDTELPSDTYIFREGEKGDMMYVIAEGEVRILRGNPETEIDHLKENDFFGEMALMQGNIRSASAKTITPCRFYTIGQDAFQYLLDNDIDFAAQIGNAMMRYRGGV